MTLAHHYAAHSDERRCSKAPFFSAKQTSDSHVASSANLTVSLNNDTATKIVEHERLMRLCETKFPRQAGVFDTSPRRRASTTIVVRNQDVVRLGLSYATGDDADTDLGNKLDGNTGAGAGVRAFEIYISCFRSSIE